MLRDEVHKGLFVRLVTDYSNVPAGTWATVDSTGTMRDGAWWFTVRWHDYTPIPERFPHIVTEYSLNLWESDLEQFEVVAAEERQAARETKLQLSPPPNLPPAPQLSGSWQARRLRRKAGVHPNQLSLFLEGDF
jgi:hypothetical protein